MLPLLPTRRGFALTLLPLAAGRIFHAQPAIPPGSIYWVVASDGSGDFQTVQSAIDHGLDRRPLQPGQRLVLQIKPGIYRERVKIPQDCPFVTLLGSNAATTVITFNLGAKNVGGTFFSESVQVEGTGFEAYDLTFENTFGPGTQAVALAVHSDRAIFGRCRFSAWQDTLYAAAGRQYFFDCYIEGHVDFIFGNASAVFENCEIHSRGPGYIAAQSRLTPESPTGFVFLRCRLTRSDTAAGVFLGRPWRHYSRVVYLHCWMDRHIRPEGWNNWSRPEDEKTAYFAELESEGPGADPTSRVAWAHQLIAGEAAAFLPQRFLQGPDHWNVVEAIAPLSNDKPR